MWARAATLVGVSMALAVQSDAATADASASSKTILDRVIAQGFVRCGIDMTPGFSGINESGAVTGFDVDFCRAVAAAALGDANAIRTSRVSTRHKFDAVRAGELDVAFGMTTWTFTRDTELGVAFPTVTFYDGQGFMAWADANITASTDVHGPVCVQKDTTSEGNLADFQASRAGVTMVPTTSSEDKFNAFAERRCAVVTGDRSELAAQRSRRTADPGAWILLPGTISREPLGPVVAAGDAQWFAIVRWAMLVPMIAEARGLTTASVATATAKDGEMRRLLGQEPDFGAALGLKPTWARRIVESVGSYDEIFTRNLSQLGLERGDNALWRDGGLIYAPPLR